MISIVIKPTIIPEEGYNNSFWLTNEYLDIIVDDLNQIEGELIGAWDYEGNSLIETSPIYSSLPKHNWAGWGERQ